MNPPKLLWAQWAWGFGLALLFGLLVGGATHNVGTGITLGVVLGVPMAFAVGRAFHRRGPGE